MFLDLSHTKLDAFTLSREFVLECYKVTMSFPSEEKFGMISKLGEQLCLVYLNIAEGCSRKSETERKRFYEIARGSLVEIDAAFDIAVELKFATKEKLQNLGKLMTRCFEMISGMMRSSGVKLDV